MTASIDAVILNAQALAATYSSDAIQALNQALTDAQMTGYNFPRSVINWSANQSLANDPGLLANVAPTFAAEYAALLPSMEALVQQNVNLWEQTYMPQYASGLSQLEGKLAQAFSQGTALPIDYDTALFTAAQSRTQSAFNQAVVEIESAHKKRGFEIPPGYLMAGIAKAATTTANALSIQATEIYKIRSEQEIDYMKHVLSTATDLRNAMMSNFVQYASIVATVNQQAVDFGKAYAEFTKESYRLLVEHLKAAIEIDNMTLQDLTEQAKLDQERNIKAIDFTIATMTLVSNITKDVGGLYANMASAALVAQGSLVAQISSS